MARLEGRAEKEILPLLDWIVLLAITMMGHWNLFSRFSITLEPTLRKYIRDLYGILIKKYLALVPSS